MPAGLLTAAGAAPGIFGKLPWLGDFVVQRLPRGFVEPWDAWLQDGLAASRVALGDAWLDRYRTAPVWRFALPAHVAGPPVAGLFLPSVDRVGRYFPLTLALPLESGPPPDLPASAASWFDALEAVALAALEEETRPEDWLSALERIGAPPLVPAERRRGDDDWILESVTPDGGLAAAFARVADRLAPDAAPARFWTSPGAEGWFLAGAGLPPADFWPRLLIGPAESAEAPP
ncbi:type VI secretion system-associated protein TagF [Inquilinus sp. NPDC058860]|uniref:type VI secretion system-associated protein TagF n=1 Tax=Inquilinus sp. NPDC058860 TaxID=3346652 RepID=UPI0036B8DCE3